MWTITNTHACIHLYCNLSCTCLNVYCQCVHCVCGVVSSSACLIFHGRGRRVGHWKSGEGWTHEVELTACGEITVRGSWISPFILPLHVSATTLLQSPPSTSAPLVSRLNYMCSLTVQSTQQKTYWVGMYLQIFKFWKLGALVFSHAQHIKERSGWKLQEEKQLDKSTCLWVQNKRMFMLIYNMTF